MDQPLPVLMAVQRQSQQIIKRYTRHTKSNLAAFMRPFPGMQVLISPVDEQSTTGLALRGNVVPLPTCVYISVYVVFDDTKKVAHKVQQTRFVEGKRGTPGLSYLPS